MNTWSDFADSESHAQSYKDISKGMLFVCFPSGVLGSFTRTNALLL